MARRGFLPTTALIFGALTAWGCGSEPEAVATSGASTGSGGSATAPTSTSSTGGSEGGGGPQVVPPECKSPSGYQLCGGPYHCPYEGDTCPSCNLDEEDKASGILGLCRNDVFKQYTLTTEQVFCMACGDGDICIDKINAGFAAFCGPFELGLLFAQNGAANRVRYADHGLWTGEPLPEPDTCPTIDDVPTCGGKCGTCADDAVCTGRSPLHPYGICASKTSFSFYASCDAIHPCDAGLGCFRWKVQPEAQAEADKFSLCLPLATCKAAAAKIPGGGYCDEP